MIDIIIITTSSIEPVYWKLIQAMYWPGRCQVCSAPIYLGQIVRALIVCFDQLDPSCVRGLQACHGSSRLELLTANTKHLVLIVSEIVVVIKSL